MWKIISGCDMWLNACFIITQEWQEHLFSLNSKGKVAVKFYSLYSSHFTLMKVLLSMRSIYNTPLRWSISCCSILAGHPLACQLTGSAFSLRPLQRKKHLFWFDTLRKSGSKSARGFKSRYGLLNTCVFFFWDGILLYVYLRLPQTRSVEQMLKTRRCFHRPLGRWQCVHLVHVTVGLQKS